MTDTHSRVGSGSQGTSFRGNNSKPPIRLTCRLDKALLVYFMASLFFRFASFERLRTPTLLFRLSGPATLPLAAYQRGRRIEHLHLVETICSGIMLTFDVGSALSTMHKGAMTTRTKVSELPLEGHIS